VYDSISWSFVYLCNHYIVIPVTIFPTDAAGNENEAFEMPFVYQKVVKQSVTRVQKRMVPGELSMAYARRKVI
jgi:hypothetical protein